MKTKQVLLVIVSAFVSMCIMNGWFDQYRQYMTVTGFEIPYWLRITSVALVIVGTLLQLYIWRDKEGK